MRKVYLFSISILAVFLAGACRSAGSTSTSQPSSASGAASSSQSSASSSSTSSSSESSFSASSQPSSSSSTPAPSVAANTGYNRHQSGVILDGAASYTVRRGDTMTRIARQLYQDGSLYPLIMMVSSVVVDPDRIFPNTRLTVPALRVNMEDATARAGINRYFLDIARIEEQRGRYNTAALIRNHTR